MFKTKFGGASSTSSSTTTGGAGAVSKPAENGKAKNGTAISTAATSTTPDAEASSSQSEQCEIGKEAKEKKDKSSWVKTIGMRTLRMRKSTDSRSSRLSLPSFSSLDRPGKSSKKSKNDDAKDNSQCEVISEHGISSLAEHVKAQSGRENTASFQNGPTTTNNVESPAAGVHDRDISGSGENSDKHDPARFLGEGLTFRGKLIGVLEVSGPRGDRICQEALSDLKMAVKAAGEHKQKVTVHVAIDGLRIRDEKTGDCLYHHQVHKISFIAQDLTDTRAFGYIFGSPDTGHRFFGIKTEKSASQVVIAMRDLFQVVFDLKKKEIEKAKQQLEMQQKFLATRAVESTPPPSTVKAEPKFSIAETYIEGACAAGVTRVPNRVVPEVDLLNLEVELTSLQEGLESIHYNLADASAPFRGSTASISSDPLNPMPKRSSMSSSNTNNTTPIPTAFGGAGDPFGDSFDPFTENYGHQPVTFQLGTNSKEVSALSSPFTSDPFAQVDPFPVPRFPGDSEFLSADPFDSPSGPFSFSFPAAEAINNAVNCKQAERKLSSSPRMNGCRTPNVNQNQMSTITDNYGGGGAGELTFFSSVAKDNWTASFEDNFVPDGENNRKMGKSLSSKPETDMLRDLDPLKAPNVTAGSSFTSSPSVIKKTQLSHQMGGQATDAAIPNSFSTNFNPSREAVKSHVFKMRSESPPNYSPPPPPRLSASSATSSHSQSNTQVPMILPPTTYSPRLTRKKSPQILKQMTIADPNSSPSTLPKFSGRIGKQFTVDTSFKDDIPNLSPPPRPPHNAQPPVITSTPKCTSSLASSAVPRPTSGTLDRSRKPTANICSANVPPEPPPRPMPTTSVSSTMQFVSPPPPLPPKKQSLASTMSVQSNIKQDVRKSLSSVVRRTSSESNDLPLPLPSRKTHGITEPQSHSATQGERYAIPLSNQSLFNSGENYEMDEPGDIPTLTMEQAVIQVASLSFADLANKLDLPVEKLSKFTIQQLAQKLTQMNLREEMQSTEIRQSNSNRTQKSQFGFDDDFSTVSAPPAITVQRSAGYDRYAVFRELALEDASGFSVMNNAGSVNSVNSEDDDRSTRTLEKPFESRESSSDRTLQADDITEPSHLKSASFATAMANTMDDVTDVNLSDDGDNAKYALEDDDDMGAGFVKSEWATFESNFDDQFATTALVKAEGGNESPWDSDEAGKSSNSPKPLGKIDFKSAEAEKSPLTEVEKRSSESEQPMQRRPPSPPPHHFQRQSSGSSKHSGRSSGGAPARPSDYSDSGRPDSGRRCIRRSSWEVERDRERETERSSGRYHDRDRDRDRHVRTDSRNSYTSRHRNESDEDMSPTRVKGREPLPYRRRSKDYDREREKEVDDEDDRSYTSQHSNYSSYARRHRRYSAGKYQHSNSRSGRRGDRSRRTPDRYSNQESDDESFEDDNNYSRKRDRDRREREYYERHHRPRPTSGTSSVKRYSRESPRHADPYYRREKRDHYKDEEGYGDSREVSDYSGQEDRRGHHGNHRRIRSKRKEYSRDSRGHYYYTNSPSWDSESCPESDKQQSRGKDGSRRPNSGKERPDREDGRPENYSPDYRSSKRTDKESSKRVYASELALNSKFRESPKFSFDDFGVSSLPIEPQSKPQTDPHKSNPSSPLREEVNRTPQVSKKRPLPESLMEAPMEQNSRSPFEDDFIESGVQTMENTSPVLLDTNESHELHQKRHAKDEVSDFPRDLKLKDDDNEGDVDGGNLDVFPPSGETKVFNAGGRRLESIKSEEEKSNEDSHSHPTTENAVQMKKSDSFNIFKQRNDDPFADDEFFA